MFLATVISMLVWTQPPNPASPDIQRAYSVLEEMGFAINSGFELEEVVTYRDPYMAWAEANGMVVGQRDPAEPRVDMATLMWAMGSERRPPYEPNTPLSISPAPEPVYFSDDLAAIDFERIYQAGDYVLLLAEMSRLGDQLVGIANAVDTLPSGEDELPRQGVTQISFESLGTRHHWDLAILDDWVDPRFFVHFDTLVEAADPEQALYSLNSGQADLFFITSDATADRLATMLDEPVRDWRSFRGLIQ